MADARKMHVVLFTTGPVAVMQRWAAVIGGLHNLSAGTELATIRLAGSIVMIWPICAHSADALNAPLDAIVALEAGVIGYEVFDAPHPPPPFH